MEVEPCLLTARGGCPGRIRTFGRGSKVLCLTAWPPGSEFDNSTVQAPWIEAPGVTSGSPAALGPVMRNVLLMVVVLFVAACGAYRFPGGPAPGTGTVSGHVVAVPCAPVEQAGKPCAGRPVGGLQITFSNGTEAHNALTDSNGRYSIGLVAGSWKVTIKSYLRIISGPPAVTVTGGSVVTADYVVDSGIRVPVPQQ